MTNTPQMPCDTDPDQDAHEGELKSLQELLVQPVTLPRLEDWISHAIDDRTKFMEDTVWGTIRWPKSVGRSLGPTLASGFLVQHSFLEMNWAVRADGTPQNLSKWVLSSEPSLWDMPGDDEHYQVCYMCRAKRPWLNAVFVRFSDKQSWDSPLFIRIRSTYRSLVAPKPYFTMGEANHAVLEDATIVEVPVRVFG
jgi:hypothetical protein